MQAGANSREGFGLGTTKLVCHDRLCDVLEKDVSRSSSQARQVHGSANARRDTASAMAGKDAGQITVVRVMSWVGVRVVSRLTTCSNLMRRLLFVVRSTGEGFATGQRTAVGPRSRLRGASKIRGAPLIVTSPARMDPAPGRRAPRATRYRGVVSRTGPSTWDFRGGRTPGSAVSVPNSRSQESGYTIRTEFRNAEKSFPTDARCCWTRVGAKHKSPAPLQTFAERTYYALPNGQCK